MNNPDLVNQNPLNARRLTQNTTDAIIVLRIDIGLIQKNLFSEGYHAHH